MQIRQLFTVERDPTRPLNEVVNTEEAIDPRSEIDEYVFTSHTVDYLRTLIDGILDTSQGHTPECLRGWISGFFGSGKSHFLKLAGALLENRTVKRRDGTETPALQYAVQQHDLDLPWERLAREFKVKTVTVNLAMAHGGGKLAQERPLLHRLASEINRTWGYSAVPHVAAVEREIRKRRKWDAFLSAVREHTEKAGELDDDGKPIEWTHRDIRDFAAEAHRILEIVLPHVLPQYANVRAYLKDREAEQPSPEAVVQLALDLAAWLDPNLGRVLLCVDEVALYLRGTAGGFDGDRVREIQGLAETVKNLGKGKVFLFATAQLRVDTIDGAFSSLQNYVVFLKDRFPPGGRLELEERDIDTVVKERWLRKDDKTAATAALQKLVRDHGGLLASAAKLRDENLIRDTAPLTDAEHVVSYYPLLPFHIRLIQSILEALRGGNQIDQTAAQSRALLTTVRSLFLEQHGAGLAGAEVGALVTFDKVYDVIRDVVRKADAATDRWIMEVIAKLDAPPALRISSVAKVVFLLQHLNPPGQPRVRVSAENIASLLYPRLGAPWAPHLEAVREACAKLLAEHFIGEEPETGYRFYRAEEQDFQKDVTRQPVDEGKLRALLSEAVTREAKELGIETLQVKNGHKLAIRIHVHFAAATLPNPQSDPAGLEVHVLWPMAGAQVVNVKLLAAQYAAAPHLLLWVLGPSDGEDVARRALKLQSALDDYAQRLGHAAATLLKGEQIKLNALREDTLPLAVRTAMAGGVLTHRGLDVPLTGAARKPGELVRETLRDAVEQVYPQLEEGCVVIDESSLRKVFSWKSGQQQPEFVADLHLFDLSGQVLVDRPFLKELSLAVLNRSEPARTGKALIERFGQPPWGWPERAVKAGYGALLRARRITVRLGDGSVLRSDNDPKAESWLTGTQAFNKAVLEPSSLNVTPAERELLTRVFAEVFDEPGLDTVEKLEKSGPEILVRWRARGREAFADLKGRQLPGASELAPLVAALDVATDPELPAGKLKELAAHVRGDEKATGVTQLAEAARLVQSVDHLRGQGKLDRLAEARNRARQLYPDSLTGVADFRKHAESLDLLRKASTVLQQDREIYARYAAEYSRRHAIVHEAAVAALDAMRGHASWSKAAESKQRELCATIESLDCVHAEALDIDSHADGRCPTCRATLPELDARLERIEARRDKAVAELDLLAGGKTPTAKPGTDGSSISMELSSADDLPRLYERIDSVARPLLATPRTVRVTFDPPER
jgi:predicted transcriptional regulator